MRIDAAVEETNVLEIQNSKIVIVADQGKHELAQSIKAGYQELCIAWDDWQKTCRDDDRWG